MEVLVFLAFKNKTKQKTHRTRVLCQPVFHLDLNFSRFKYWVTLHILNLRYEGTLLLVIVVD